MFWLLLLLPCFVIHEWAHACTAVLLGDERPRLEGRLSLNPLRHLHPVGSVIVPAASLFLTRGAVCFAFARPVHIEPGAFEHPLRDVGLVAAAGPFANIVAGMVAAVVWRFVKTPDFLAEGLAHLSLLSLCLAAINLLPLPPLDGSKMLAALLPERIAGGYLEHGIWGLLALVVLVIVAPTVLHADLIQGYFDITVLSVFRALGGV